jgi:hypothetical protein
VEKLEERILFKFFIGDMFFRFEKCFVGRRGYPRLAKGAGLKIRQSLVRDPVAQAFVGSSPTPRTIIQSKKIVEYSEYLRVEGNNPTTIECKTRSLIVLAS